jgi:hypothetical protein
MLLVGEMHPGLRGPVLVNERQVCAVNAADGDASRARRQDSAEDREKRRLALIRKGRGI